MTQLTGTFLRVIRFLESMATRRQRRAHHALILAAAGMTAIRDPKRLTRVLVSFVRQATDASYAALLLRDRSAEPRFRVASSRSTWLTPQDLDVSPNAAVVEMLNLRREPLVLESLEAQTGITPPNDPARELAAAAGEWMRTVEARLIAPAFVRDHLIGFLLLGPQRSGRPYTAEDARLFAGLAPQAALAMEAARCSDELMRQETSVIESERLMRLGEFAAGMVGDLRDPLTVISGETELYLRRHAGREPEADRIMKSIFEECRRMTAMTRGMTRLSRPPAQEPGLVDLRALAQECLDLLASRPTFDRITRQVQWPAQLPPVIGVQGQLREMLTGIVLYACHGMQTKGGALEISAGVCGTQIELCVRDTGPGLSQEHMRQLFDPLYVMIRNGHGSNLYTAQRILQAHRGSIQVHSTDGRGTTYTLRLPASLPA